MPVSPGEADVAAAFAGLAEILASGLNAESVLALVCRHCIELTDASTAVAVMTTSRDGGSLVVSSDDLGRRLATGSPAGIAEPWSDCTAGANLIPGVDLRASRGRWPWFAEMALQAGLTTVTMVPVSVRAGTSGALALLGETVLDLASIQLACSLAEAAGTAIVLSYELRRQEAAISQLQTALSSRIVIEQAKGVLAERWQVPPDEAFDSMRRHARTTQRRLTELARAIVDGTCDLPSRESA